MTGTMATKAFWEKPNPRKKSTPLTPAQKSAAKKRAAAAGRKYPNLVDNAAVAKKPRKPRRHPDMGIYAVPPSKRRPGKA